MDSSSTQSIASSKFLSLYSKQPAAVNSKLLFAFYLVIPICGALVLADMLFLEQRLLDQYLPKEPYHWLIWAIVFDTPHIVASFFSFFDREYIHYYRTKLLKALSIIVPAVLFFTVVSPAIFPNSIDNLLLSIFTGFFVTYTMYHVLSQQFGIAMALMKLKPDYQYELLRWGATLAGTLMYALVMVDSELRFMGIVFGDIFLTASAGLIALTCVIGWNVSKNAREKKGQLFMYSNLIMLLCVYLFLLLDYGVFVIVIPRLVHDFTAFYIYGVHDHNRNREKVNNLIYKPFYAFSPILICPILAIVLGNIIDRDQGLFPALILIISLLHYYVEGFIWKGNTLHRRFVAFR